MRIDELNGAQSETKCFNLLQNASHGRVVGVEFNLTLQNRKSLSCELQKINLI